MIGFRSFKADFGFLLFLSPITYHKKTMTCQNCGQTNENGQNYCRDCGAPLVQPQAYQPPRADAQSPKPYGWASPSSPLHDLGDTTQPRAVEPLQTVPIMNSPVAPNPFANSQPNVAGFRCPRCNSTAPPIVKSKMSDAGLITLILMIFFCFPLFWIGFLMREQFTVCPACLTRLS